MPGSVEQNREAQKRYRLKHPEKVAARLNAWRAKNTTKIAAYNEASREKRNVYSRDYRLKNPEKTKTDVIEWKAKNIERNREHVRAANIKNRYGVTREQHENMKRSQGHRCAICNIEQSKLKRRFCIDHDHKTKVVRGLICHTCNTVLGHAYDSIEILRAAIAYLERHRI